MKPGWAEPVAATIGATLIKTLAATWRFRERGKENWQPLWDAKRPFIFVLWHSRLLPLLALHKREGVVVLISRHRDGGYLADLAAQWGYRPVRGSTQRGGEAGLLGIVRALQGGAVVAMTPDGPRGPAERVQPGAVAAAQHAGVRRTDRCRRCATVVRLVSRLVGSDVYSQAIERGRRRLQSPDRNSRREGRAAPRHR